MKKLLAVLRPSVRRRRGTATVLTVVTPQSAIADACTSGNCWHTCPVPSGPLNTAAVSTAPAASQYWPRSGGPGRA